MPNRFPTTLRHTLMSAQVGYPGNSAASNAQDEMKDYLFDELRDMSFPPCTTAEYAALRDALFSDGDLICAWDPFKTGELALKFLKEGKTTILKWLAAHCAAFTMEIAENDDDPVFLERMCDWLQRGAHGCKLQLNFASLQAFDHVASETPWSLLSIFSRCSALDLGNFGRDCCSFPKLGCSPGPQSLELTYRCEDGMQTFASLVRARAASTTWQLNLNEEIDKSIAVELITALLRANSLRQITLAQECNMTAAIFEALALNIASGFRRMVLNRGNIDAMAAEHFAAFLACSSSLEELVITSTELEEALPKLLPGFASNTSLKSLMFKETGLRTDTFMQLAAVLTQNPCLQKLTVLERHVDGSGVEEIADRFCKHVGLRVLKLNLASETCTPDSAEAGMAMANMVRNNPRLRVLNLYMSNRGNDEFQGEGHRQFIEAAMASANLWEVDYDFPDRAAAEAHFEANRQRHFELARSGLTLASIDTPLPSEVEDIINDILASLSMEDHTALEGLADFAAQALAPTPVTASATNILA